MGSTSKSAWTSFERQIAADFSAVLGERTYRVPLSGSSSRHNYGDVIIPKDYAVVIEAKFRASNAQHGLYKGATEDAVKSNIDPAHTVLCTKVKHQRGYLVTVDSTLFWKMLAVPGVLDLLRKES